MESTLQSVIQAAGNPETSMPVEAVRLLASRYPFFTLPAILRLKRDGAAMTDDERGELMQAIALNSPDPQAMFLCADVQYEGWGEFYPRSGKLSTIDAISKFLDTYGQSSPAEDALLERLIFNPTPDYSTILAREAEADMPVPGEAPADSQDALINSFILKHRDGEDDLLPRESATETMETAKHEETAPVRHTEPQRPAQTAPFDSSLSESLAKIYIRQKRYDKAFEIIHTLSLNNPKKSAYFADQLRFLRKLMLNRKRADNSK